MDIEAIFAEQLIIGMRSDGTIDLCLIPPGTLNAPLVIELNDKIVSDIVLRYEEYKAKYSGAYKIASDVINKSKGI